MQPHTSNSSDAQVEDDSIGALKAVRNLAEAIERYMDTRSMHVE